MDKALHFGCCFFITAIAIMVAFGVCELPLFKSQIIGFGIGMLTGVMKELWDCSRHGEWNWKYFSLGDIIADACGCLLAFLFAFGL